MESRYFFAVFRLLSTCLLLSPGSDAHLKPTVEQRKEIQRSVLPEENKLRMQLQFHPHDAAAHKQLIELLKERYAFRAIVTEDAKWLRDNPRDFVALIEITSYSKTALNDPEFSIAQLNSFLSRISRSEDPSFYDNLTNQVAGELQRRGHADQALRLSAELVRLNPDDPDFWVRYGSTLSALGRSEEAVRALRRAVELEPSLDDFHKALATVLLRSGDLTHAETEYRAALSLYERQYKKGDSSDTLTRKLVKIQADNREEGALAETRLKLAHVLLLEKKYDEAIGQTNSAFDADRYEFAAFYLRAQIYEAKGDADTARKVRDDASVAIRKQAAKGRLPRQGIPAIDPRVLFLSDTLWNEDSGQPAFPSEIVAILEAKASLSTAEHVGLATAYFALGRAPQAKQEWEKAIATDPTTADNAIGHANLGRELLKANDVTSALSHLRRAYELDPENLTYRMDYETVTRRFERTTPAARLKTALLGPSHYMIAAGALLVVLLALALSGRKVYRMRKASVPDLPSTTQQRPTVTIAEMPVAPSTTSEPRPEARQATPGDLLAAGLIAIMEREGACLGATVLRNPESGKAVAIGSELRTGTGAALDKHLAEGFQPIGVFVVTRVDDLTLRTLVLTHKSVSEQDEPFVKTVIHNCANAVFPGLLAEKIAKA